MFFSLHKLSINYNQQLQMFICSQQRAYQVSENSAAENLGKSVTDHYNVHDRE